MADVDFAQAPRGLAETLAALIKRKAYQTGIPAGSNRKSSTDGIVTARLAP